MRNNLVVSFRGPLPSKGKVSAYTSFESMLALTQATTMVIHFANTGKIRRKKFAELDIDLTLNDTREGSFEFLLEYGDQAVFVGKYVASAVAGGIIWDLIKGAISRVIGGDAKGAVSALEKNPDFKEGDLGALIQALEPSIRRAHSAINHGANKIVITIEGEDEGITFDARSKAYLLENIANDTVRTKRFQITSFDGRARTGRAFDLEDEQGYTFELAREADFRSLKVIADAAYAYALRSSGNFTDDLEAVCRFTSIDAVDGRIKKMVFHQARKDLGDIGAHRFEPD